MFEQTLDFVRVYWPTLGLMAVVAFSLLVLRATVGSVPASAPASSTPAVAEEQPQAQPEQEQKPKKRWQTAEGTKSLREEVAELVAEDPETAANILKTWIGTPA